MLALRWSGLGGVMACALLFAAACGDDGGREDLQTTDSAVSAQPDPGATVPPTTPGMPTTPGTPVTTPEGTPSASMDASMAGLEPAADLDAGVVLVPAAESDAASQPPAAPHPLSGRYAVRTVSYARQKATVAGEALDLVSKGVLLSVADVSATGTVTEHLCYFELYNEQGLFSWTSPVGTERVSDSVVQLERRGDVFVRPLEADKTNLAWSAANRPTDCTSDGAAHSSGCTCVLGDALPTTPSDCRVRDLDDDGQPGLRLSIGAARPADLTSGEALLQVQMAGIKAVEWQLPAVAGASLVGQVEGSLEQAQLSVQGELASSLGRVRNAACTAETGHVELVRGDFDCAKLIAGRSANLDSLGVFNSGLDAPPPMVAMCPDPDCGVDSDHDGTVDCQDACPADPVKTLAGLCICGVPETNSDGDSQPDCLDECDMDPLKTAPGVCNCGVPDTDTDGDGAPDCLDACPADPVKTAAGLCNCGVPETDSDGDRQPDCLDECDVDPLKTAPGVCDCGVSDADTDRDGTPDCLDECDVDPLKTAPGVCDCGVSDADTDRDGTPDCLEECDSDPNKTAPGVCNCGVRDADLNGDGSVDCSDACPDDPAKVAPGVCDCGVPDTDTDRDGRPDCRDECPTNPALTDQGPCGCEACPLANPLAGTYAVRTTIYGKARTGTSTTDATTSKAISYALVTITSNADGSATLSETSCYAETVPQVSSSGYGWSPPAWCQALPPAVRHLTAAGGGVWTGTTGTGQLGWSSSRQPASCSASSTPPSGWPTAAWGSTCTCRTPATSLPPYERDEAPYDCRLTDPDADGYPGISLYVSASAPSSPTAVPSSFSGARVLAVSEGASRWTITPSADGKHWATIDDNSENMIVGCVGGLACTSGLKPDSPRSRVCPAALNKAQFIPVVGAFDSCSEIIEQRGSLFVTNQDGPWPDENACSSP